MTSNYFPGIIYLNKISPSNNSGIIDVGSITGTIAWGSLTGSITNQTDLNTLLTKSVFSFRKVGSSGGWTALYNSSVNCTALVSATYNKNNLRLVPFVVGIDSVIDQINFNILVGGDVGTKGRFGIYNSSSLLPNSLIWQSSSEFAVDSIALITQSITPSITLTKGLYFIAFIHNSTTSIQADSIPANSCPNVLGIDVTSGYVTYLRYSFTYASLPDSLVGVTYSLQSGSCPSFLLRLTT